MSVGLRIAGKWLLVFIWADLIWFLSSIPDLHSGFEQDFLLRKVAHALEFAIFMLLLYNALPKPKRSRWQRFALAVLLATAYATIDEIHQGFVPGRQPSPRDVAIDALGIVLGVLSIYVWQRWSAKRETRKKLKKASA